MSFSLILVASQRWKYRSICCIPNFVIAMVVVVFISCIIALVLKTDATHFNSKPNDHTTIFRSVFIAMLCAVVFVLLLNLCTFLQIIKTLVTSHQRRITGSFTKIGQSKEENCISSLRNEVETIVQMVSFSFWNCTQLH